MTEKNYTWYKLANNIEELQIPASGLMEVEVEGKRICISLFKGQLQVCTAKCPHAGGRMADGYIDAVGNIVCPIHRYKFNLENGHNTSGEGYYLMTYPLEKRADGIFLGIEQGGLLSLLK